MRPLLGCGIFQLTLSIYLQVWRLLLGILQARVEGREGEGRNGGRVKGWLKDQKDQFILAVFEIGGESNKNVRSGKSARP